MEEGEIKLCSCGQYFVGLKDDKLCPACFMRDKIKNKPKGPLVNDSEWAKMAGLK